MKWRAGTLALVFSTLAAIPALGGDSALTPVRDNTLYELLAAEVVGGGGPPSNGAGEYFFAGNTAFDEVRRGLLAFDIAAAIPAGSVITSATLTLEMSRSISGASAVELHRVSSDWGEGDSDAPGEEGQGAPADTGDATWLHTFYPSGFWGAPGGDFSAAVSATQTVDGTGTYTWGSTPEMVADVQSWLDSPASNFGWLVMGDEGSSPSAKRFNTRENGSGSPQLTLTYQTPVPTIPGWALTLLALMITSLALWRLHRLDREASH